MTKDGTSISPESVKDGQMVDIWAYVLVEWHLSYQYFSVVTIKAALEDIVEWKTGVTTYAFGTNMKSIMPSSPLHQWSPTMHGVQAHPDTEASTSGKVVTGSKRQQVEETSAQLQRFGDGPTSTWKAKSAPPLQHRVGQALDIETKSHTERLKEAIKDL
ncbi:hypothetical protein PISMIDRAFT_23203 [Pisolithus microcarpus 441]|uniref:Uncharacterized protein n=1 Tax=Pisolithus microcarpus 441 TaxID=765257 RepID=A0A0C9Z5A7_9AGAM|nr:hypothetical protein BKA83DRAFT_23203 [Pisolithus microcarpus]KIK24306.1 hypothetical protein PISMIDRAFT_23203 [Pisolithus microcarpus 441]